MADLDGDGRPELSSGSSQRRLSLYPGIVGGVFGAPQLLLDFREDSGSESSLAVVDWDRDGVLDLLVGTRSGRVWFVKNAGTPARADFARFRPVALQADGEDLLVAGFAAPAVGDWDGDGDPDLVVGDHEGSVWLYRNSAAEGQPQLGEAQLLVHKSADPAASPQIYLKPEIVDWNGDGLPDLIVGDDWTEKRERPELSATAQAELDAREEELRILRSRLGGARERVGDEVCRALGLDWHDLWKLDAAAREHYQSVLDRALLDDQDCANAQNAIESITSCLDELTATAYAHGRVWVYLRR